MSSIRPFDRYKDKNGKAYQVLTTAISLATEKEEVIVQQLYGGYINISIPEDKFLRIFSKVSDDKPDEKASDEKTSEEKALENEEKLEETRVKTETPPVTVRPSPATVEVPSDKKDDGEQDPAVRDMLAFLDSDDFDEKYMIVEHMTQNDELNDTYIDNMAASIDIVIDDGPLDGRIRELLKCLGTRKRFENTRLRG